MRGSAAFRTGVAPGGALAPGWVKNELWRKARTVPSLDLRFADDKSLVDATTGASLVTFTRASSGTFVGSDGVLRSAVTNLLLRSEEFDNAYWTPIEVIRTPNAATSPSGLTTADLITEVANSNYHEIFVNSGVTAGTYTFSVFVKNNLGTRHLNICFSSGSTNALSLRVNAATGGLSSIYTEGSVFSAATSTVIFYPNGWYRVSISFSVNTVFAIQLALSTSSAAPAAANYGLESYAGDGTSGIYLWGAQLEQSTTVGEYIPTTSTINSAPRFDHNPTTGESLGLLVEEARTNLLLQSETLLNAPNQSGSGLSNFFTPTLDSLPAPNGSTTQSVKFVSTATTSQGLFIRQVSLSLTAQTYSTSLYFYVPTQSGVSNWGLNLDFADVESVEVVGLSLFNQWVRVSMPKTLTANRNFIDFNIRINGSTAPATAGVTFYAWGAQLEAGAFATSYIPTTTAAATRSADVASITGTAFTSWYRQDEGTVFAEGGPTNPTLNNTQLLITINDGSANNRMYLGKKFDSTTTAEFGVASGGVGQAFILTAPSSVSNARLAAGYKVNDFAVASSGGALATDTSGSVPVSSTQLLIGTLDTGSNNINGTIRRFTYWPVRLPDATLQSITQ